ncbi:MAG TPA: hypothetical protein VMW54_15155 [Terriglobia bacterium]|nr:hypothetical protein [Terriglobia bacterium]
MDKKRAIQALMIAFTAITLIGCQSGSQNPGGAEGSPSAASSPAAGARSSSSSPALQRRSEAPAQAAQAPATETVTVPAGTEIHIRLSSGISSATASSGNGFQGSLSEPLVVRGVTVAARGSVVNGQVTSAVSSGRLKRPAELSLVLTSITPEGGQQTPISTHTWSVSGKSHKKRDITMIGGGAGLGAAIGAIAGGGKGAAVGGLVGAAAGTGGAYATGKKEIQLSSETGLTFRLSAAATFTVLKAG